MANMLKLIGKNFFSKKPTRLYPIDPEREPFERSRGQIVFNENTCILCSICARKCPADAIKVDRANGIWELDTLRCIICGECVNACPKKSITMSNQRRHSTEVKPIQTFQMELPKPPTPKPAAPKPVTKPETNVD